MQSDELDEVKIVEEKVMADGTVIDIHADVAIHCYWVTITGPSATCHIHVSSIKVAKVLYDSLNDKGDVLGIYIEED